MKQKANVSHGRKKMDMVRRREVSYVRRLRSLHRGQVVRDAVLESMERKKGIKKQRRSKEMD
jgi:hypothetical protein